MRPLSRSLSSLGDGKGGDRARSNDEPEVPANKKKSAKLMNKAFMFILNGPIWVHPRAAVPIRLFLWGGASCPARPTLSDSQFIT